jgi:hypothetical protein
MNCLQAVGKKAALATPAFKGDGFVKSPSAIRQAVRQAHGPEQGRRTHGPEQSRRAALRFIFSHCGVLIYTPHSQRFARLASGAFYCAV